MSTKDNPIMMYGVDAEDIAIKPEYWMPWDELEKLPKDALDPQYEDFDEFVESEIDDYSIGSESNDYSFYIGIFPHYDWQKPNCTFKTEKDAAKYIAFKLSPFCNKSRDEIEAACHYIEDTYYG